jgi:hypothetical protein
MLRCEICVSNDDEARGWRAFLASGEDENEAEVEVVIFCPACAEREFGELSGFMLCLECPGVPAGAQADVPVSYPRLVVRSHNAQRIVGEVSRQGWTPAARNPMMARW